MLSKRKPGRVVRGSGRGQGPGGAAGTEPAPEGSPSTLGLGKEYCGQWEPHVWKLCDRKGPRVSGKEKGRGFVA